MGKKDFLLKLTSVFLVSLLIIYGVFSLGYILRPTSTDGAFYQIETFHSLPNNSLEVIVYGSSHAFRGVNTKELYDQFGIGAYNYGWHWQAINTTKAFLIDSLETQTPKIALIETFKAATVLEDINVTPEVFYCRYLHSKKAKKSYFLQCLGDNPTLERYVSYSIPLVMFHDNWNSLTQANFKKLSATPDESLVNYMGFSASDIVSPIQIPDYKDFQQEDFSIEAITELSDIVSICNEKEITVIFFTVPWQGEYIFSQAMSDFAADNNCVYINLFEYVNEIGLDGNTDFSDIGHLNTNGATKVANFLGIFLKENYQLTDFRTQQNNLLRLQQ